LMLRGVPVGSTGGSGEEKEMSIEQGTV